MTTENIHRSILDTIGNTPLVELARLGRGLEARLCAKIERFNPLGSVKDRPAYAMIETAEKSGALKPGMTIVEATSGNTGLGLAMVSAVKGYKVKFLMEEGLDTSEGFVKIAELFGAEIERLPSFSEAVEKSLELAKAPDSEYFVTQQFQNPANPDAHYKTTAEEILRDTGGEVKAFVASFGTGGTISGVGKRLKEHDPSIRVVLVEPDTVPVLSNPAAVTCSDIHGVGPNFAPKNLHREYIDECRQVTEAEAREFMIRLAREEGILVGPSSGAIVAKALEVASEFEKGDIVVCVLCDLGERYVVEGVLDSSVSP